MGFSNMKSTVLSTIAFCVLAVLSVNAGLEDSIANFNQDNEPATFRGETIENNAYKVTSSFKAGGVKQMVTFGFKTNPVPRFIVRYLNTSAFDSALYAVGVGITRIIEYNETITPLESTSFIKLKNVKDADWSSLKNAVTDVTNGTTSYKTITSSLVFSDDDTYGNLNFTLQATITTKATFLDGYKVSPAGLKYSLFINDFPFQYENSNLMVVTAFWTRNSTVEFDDSDSAFGSLTLGGGDGAFGYDVKYTSGGASYNVSCDRLVTEDIFGDHDLNLPSGETVETSVNAKIITFGFVGSNAIAWDPQISIGNADAFSNDAPRSVKLGFSAVALSVAVSSLMLIL